MSGKNSFTMAEKQVKVVLWSVPRSMSTVLTKCLSAIDGIEVYLEPYTYAASVAGMFQSLTGRELPVEFEGNEADYEAAKEAWKKQTGSTVISERISHSRIREDLETTKSKYVFIKEMAKIFDDVRGYLPKDLKHAFITREPSRVYASFRKAIIDARFYSLNNYGDLDIIRDDPPHLEPMCWFEKQYELWRYVKDNIDPKPVVIDAFDLASQPERMLKSFCDAVGFPYSDSLLKWSPSQDFPNNFVTAGEDLFETISAFYSRAFSSTHFVHPAEEGPIPRDQLTDDVIKCVDHSMPFYLELHANRIQVS